MDALLNQLKASASALDQAVGQPRLGIVSSTDPNKGTVRVLLQPESVLTGWLPVMTPWVGAGWGMACPPSPGDQVMVLPQEGDAEHGVMIGGVVSEDQPPPSDNGTTAQCGELWLMHGSGSFIRLRNDGSIQGRARIWQFEGDLHVAGNVFDQHGALDALRQHYNFHQHTDSRSGLTTTTNQQD